MTDSSKRNRKHHAGMGALPCKGGVFFRVWAPHADQVWVTGDFNDWSKTRHPLVHEGDGYWYVEVKGAKDTSSCSAMAIPCWSGSTRMPVR